MVKSRKDVITIVWFDRKFYSSLESLIPSLLVEDTYNNYNKAIEVTWNVDRGIHDDLLRQELKWWSFDKNKVYNPAYI